MKRNARSSLPEGGKARRVYLHLRDAIANGLHPDQSALPGEQRLAERFGVSRVTVRRALDALDGDGLIERRAGSGTRVRLRQKARPLSADAATLLPQLAEMSESTKVQLLSFAYGPAPAPVAEAMGLNSERQVQIATRVRLSEGRAFSHLTTYVPEDIARNYSEADLATSPLYQLLERGGVRIGEARQSVSATLAAPEVAAALDISVGAALISLRRTVRDLNGRGVEYLSALYRPDMFRIDMTLARVGEDSARHWEPRIGTAP